MDEQEPVKRPTAAFARPRRIKNKERRAVIRLGTGGAQDGADQCIAFWLTIKEAEALHRELGGEIAKAKRAAGIPPEPEPEPPPPEPPVANSAALPAA